MQTTSHGNTGPNLLVFLTRKVSLATLMMFARINVLGTIFDCFIAADWLTLNFAFIVAVEDAGIQSYLSALEESRVRKEVP